MSTRLIGGRRRRRRQMGGRALLPVYKGGRRPFLPIYKGSGKRRRRQQRGGSWKSFVHGLDNFGKRLANGIVETVTFGAAPTPFKGVPPP